MFSFVLAARPRNGHVFALSRSQKNEHLAPPAVSPSWCLRVWSFVPYFSFFFLRLRKTNGSERRTLVERAAAYFYFDTQQYNNVTCMNKSFLMLRGAQRCMHVYVPIDFGALHFRS